jgi:hypothetical protein
MPLSASRSHMLSEKRTFSLHENGGPICVSTSGFYYTLLQESILHNWISLYPTHAEVVAVRDRIVDSLAWLMPSI